MIFHKEYNEAVDVPHLVRLRVPHRFKDEEVMLTLEVIEVKQSSNTNKFPAFKTFDLYGNEVTNSFFAQHKLTLVNFWFPT